MNRRKYLNAATRGLWGAKKKLVWTELSGDFDIRVRELMLQGLTEQNAEREAIDQLGNPELVSAGMRNLYTLPSLIGSGFLFTMFAMMAFAIVNNNKNDVVVVKATKNYLASGESVYRVEEHRGKTITFSESVGKVSKFDAANKSFIHPFGPMTIVHWGGLLLEVESLKKQIAAIGGEVAAPKVGKKVPILKFSIPGLQPIYLEWVVQNKKRYIPMDSFINEIEAMAKYGKPAANFYISGLNALTVHIGKKIIRLGTTKNSNTTNLYTSQLTWALVENYGVREFDWYFDPPSPACAHNIEVNAPNETVFAVVAQGKKTNKRRLEFQTIQLGEVQNGTVKFKLNQQIEFVDDFDKTSFVYNNHKAPKFARVALMQLSGHHGKDAYKIVVPQKSLSAGVCK